MSDDTTNPRTQVKDAVLANLSPNVNDDAVLDSVMDIVERQTADAALAGPGTMVDFDDYMAVTL